MGWPLMTLATSEDHDHMMDWLFVDRSLGVGSEDEQFGRDIAKIASNRCRRGLMRHISTLRLALPMDSAGAVA